MSIYEKAFAKSNKTDAILVVQGKKMHVNKAVLSFHSDYFDKLFKSNFAEEILIEDVEFEDFVTLLSLIHDNPLEINKKNTVNLLNLADQFQLRGPKCHVEHFIICANAFKRHQMLILADKYKLDILLEHTVALYDSKEAFRDFWDFPVKISNDLRIKMFDGFFKK